LTTLLQDWPAMRDWLLSEEPSEEDLFDRRQIATRLSRHLRMPSRKNGTTIGLVGPQGQRI
jgi:hypothetical protein